MARTWALILMLVPQLATAGTKRLLVVTHTTGFRHDSIPTAERVLGEIGARSGLYETLFCRTAEDVQAMLTPQSLSSVDAVFFANTTGDLGIPDLATFLAWVRSGHAFLGAHSASDTYHPTCESGSGYADMLGAEVRTHGAFSSVEARVEERTHTSVAHLPPSWAVLDEIYEFAVNPRPRTHVVLSLDRHPDDGHPDAGQPGDFPLAWYARYGDGAVFYTALGHRAEVWESSDYQKHLEGALRWALDATDRATLTIPASASRAGLFGTHFRTDLWLSNRSAASELNVAVRLLCAASAPCGARSLTLNPRGTTLLRDVVGDFLGAPGGFGALELSWPKAQGPVVAFSRVFTAVGAGTSGAAVPALPASAARTRSLFVGLGSGGEAGYRANAGVSNAGRQDAPVTFELFDGAGRPLGRRHTTTVGAAATLQLDDVFAALGADASVAPLATLVVSSPLPLFAYVSVVDNATGDSILLTGAED